MARCQLLPHDVIDAPELLVLAALDTNLWTLHIALVAAFPEINHELAKTRDRPTLRAARLLSNRACRLEMAIARYRRVLHAVRAPPENTNDPLF